MVGSRAATALAGFALSVLVSAAVWYLFDFAFLFVFLPFVPFLFLRGTGTERPVRVCPTCGFRSADPEVAFCPRDGTKLEK